MIPASPLTQGCDILSIVTTHDFRLAKHSIASMSWLVCPHLQGSLYTYVDVNIDQISAVEEFLLEPSFSPHVIDHISLQLFAKRSPQDQPLEDKEIAQAPLDTVEEFLFEPAFSPHAIDHISLQLLAKRSPQEQPREEQAQLETVEEFLFEPTFSPHVIDTISLQLFAKRSPQEQPLADEEFAPAPLPVEEFLQSPVFSPHATDHFSLQLLARR